jgi:cardiolipin synthase (CMP-forming)
MNNNINLPNIISVLRMISVPFMLFFVFSENEMIFKWILFFSLISDILDGLIARVFKLQTELGASLDAIADLGMYCCAVLGLFFFKIVFLKNHWIEISIVLGFFIIARILTFIRYKKIFNSFHSYLSKVMAYIQGGFIMILFLVDFEWYLFYPAIIIGIISNIEEYILLFLLKKDEVNVKGLYWIIKKRKVN